MRSILQEQTQTMLFLLLIRVQKDKIFLDYPNGAFDFRFLMELLEFIEETG